MNARTAWDNLFGRCAGSIRPVDWQQLGRTNSIKNATRTCRDPASPASAVYSIRAHGVQVQSHAHFSQSDDQSTDRPVSYINWTGHKSGAQHRHSQMLINSYSTNWWNPDNPQRCRPGHFLPYDYPTSPSTCPISPLVTASAPPVFSLSSYGPSPTSNMTKAMLPKNLRERSSSRVDTSQKC